ncbi:hypothetical protein Pfra02_04390 [Pseudomonas fragi]|nr:hypothetical protein Pfra02_04390 [Pseudomonas fragi]
MITAAATYLMVYICAAGDKRDCQVYAQNSWEGASQAAQCEDNRLALTQQLSAANLKTVRFECEQDLPYLTQGVFK